jgi:hypothetical protein
LRQRRKNSTQKRTLVASAEEGDRLVLQPLTPEHIRRLCGSLKKGPSALKFLLKERRGEGEP